MSLKGTSGAGRRARRVQDLQVWGRAGGGESEGGGGAGRRAKGPWGGAKRLTGCGWGGGRGAGKSEAGLAGGSSGSRGKGNPANKAVVVGADALNKSRSMMHHACSLSAVPLHTSPLAPRTSGWRCGRRRRRRCSAEPVFISKDLIAFSAMLSCFISFIQTPKFSETRYPRSTFFVAQATNPDENEDENEP